MTEALDISAPFNAVSSPRRKLSVMDVATSPLAVNFHTWRINALTTNAFRQCQFLEHAKKTFDEAGADSDKKAMRMLKDLSFFNSSRPSSGSSRLSEQAPKSTYSALRALLTTPVSALGDAEWLLAIKTLLEPQPELYEEFKEAFGIREDDHTPHDVDEAFTPTSAAAAAETGKPFVRRSSSKVKFETREVQNAGSDEDMPTILHYPPTPAAVDLRESPFLSISECRSPTPMSPAGPADKSFAFDATAPAAIPEQEQNEVCLNGHYIAYDLHVAMMDRPGEMRELMARNPELFENIRNSCCADDDRWIELEDVLLTSREEMDDLTWMHTIGDHMGNNPSLFAMLKELVGYDMHEEVAEESEDEDSDLYDEEDDTFEKPEWLDTVVKMREAPEIMQRLENDYPQFFANVKKAIAAEDETEYSHFLSAFYSPASTMSDQEWEREMLRYLARSKSLLSQLREIALYELDVDEDKPEPETSIFEPAVKVDFSSRPAPTQAQGPASKIEVKARADPSATRDLETDHPLFFNLLRKQLTSRDEYHRFLRALYAPREHIADDKWEALITHRFLSGSRRLRQMFREVVDAMVISTSEIMDSDDEEYLGRFEAPIRGVSDARARILRLELAAPELFNKIKRKLGDQYGRFKALLVTPREEMNDDEWAERIETYLESDIQLSTGFAQVAGIQQLRKDTASKSTAAAEEGTGEILSTSPSLQSAAPVIAPVRPPSPTSSTHSGQYAIREQIASSIGQLDWFLGLKSAVDDDKVFGKLLHGLIEKEETEKIAHRDDATPRSEDLSGGILEHANVSNDKHVLRELLHEVLPSNSEVAKRVESWLETLP
ncbi:uncharacterized protein EV422DRAFT_154834 [Fimicolochytrium jonesii]|uniref:uncharacterized protein n=1 Tax=Fimicolochytrium jonesii TaxID=1396493 RepID=UPI0022FDE45A|nr:uncharacterized protein EV422DRAFT_154834 [Fimicolochytrium jonesii]KAI8826118.1 hypothetical protein EV422DRAFT_154834 [Fimicolochytrium jonesii]